MVEENCFSRFLTYTYLCSKEIDKPEEQEIENIIIILGVSHKKLKCLACSERKLC